jgi:hypothetical protein
VHSPWQGRSQPPATNAAPGRSRHQPDSTSCPSPPPLEGPNSVLETLVWALQGRSIVLCDHDLSGVVGIVCPESETSHMKCRPPTVASCLLLIVATSGFAAGQERWGAETRGLQLAISPARASWTAGEDPQFEVTFRNSSAKDVLLNLGFTLANSRRKFPLAVSLLLVESGGRSLELRLPGPTYVSGRIDDYAVRLPPGAVQELILRLSAFHGLKLATGHYRVSARFEGRDAHYKNLDMDRASRNFWQGTLESGIGEFEIRERKQNDDPPNAAEGARRPWSGLVGDTGWRGGKRAGPQNGERCDLPASSTGLA